MPKFKENEIVEIDESTIGIVISRKYREELAIIDKEDYPRVKMLRWQISSLSKRNKTRYAIADDPFYVMMHRLIMSFPDGLQVDHIDGNGLNNKKQT